MKKDDASERRARRDEGSYAEFPRGCGGVYRYVDYEGTEMLVRV